ncbi:MAG: hypothetical protein ACI8RZ_003528 [Myxococcota bacterium]|jgi:hypothetical protein
MLLSFLLSCHGASDSAAPVVCEPLQISVAQEWNEEDLPERLTTSTRPSLAMGDFDGDGWLDVFFGYADGSMFLWNDGTGDLTPGPEGPIEMPWPSASAAAIGDIDGDGDLDLYLGRARDSDHLLINDGGRSFTLTTLPDSETAASHGAFGDFDRDGDLDLIVGTMPENPDTEGIVNGTELGTGSRLYLQDGGDFQVSQGALPAETAAGMVWQISPIDADSDGDLDLYLAHDFGPFLAPNQLLLNDGTGYFTVAEDCFCNIEMHAMGTAVGDANGDGYPDLYITDAGGPNLLINEGDGTFYDATIASGADIGPTPEHMTSWGTTFADLNQDGCLDLPVLFGNLGQHSDYITENINPDWIDGEEQPDLLLLSDCEGGFSQAEESGFSDPSRTRNIAIGDLDRDGRPDIVTAGKHFIRAWRTAGGCPPGLTVSLQQAPGASALGAKISVIADGRHTTQWILPSTTNSASSAELYFGLSGADTAESVTVHWMDGSQETFNVVPAGFLTLTPP